MFSHHTKIYFSHINSFKSTFYLLYNNYYKSSGLSTNISRNIWLWYTSLFLSQLIWWISVWPREDKSIMWLLESRWLCIPGVHIIGLSILVALWNTSSVSWQHQHLCFLRTTYSERSGSSHMTALHNILTLYMRSY